jgi:hypothetical protein
MRHAWILVAPTITGLPWTTWILLLAAIVPGLALALLFYAIHRERGSAASERNRRG